MSGDETTVLEYAMGLLSFVGIVMGLLILAFQWHVLTGPLVVVGFVAVVLAAASAIGRLQRAFRR